MALNKKKTTTKKDGGESSSPSVSGPKPQVIPTSKRSTGVTAQWVERMNKDRKFKGKAQVRMAHQIRTPYALRRPTGILSLDIALGGGLHAGGAVEIYGAQSAGKTYLMWRVFAQNQMNYGHESKLFLLETELRPDKWQARTAGCCIAYSEEEIEEMDRIRVANGYSSFTAEELDDLRLQIGDIVVVSGATAEDGLDVMVEALKEGFFQIAAIDSLGAMLTKEVEEGSVGDSHYAGPSRVITQFQNKVWPLYTLDRPDGSMLETTLLGINQVRCISKNELVITEYGIRTAWEARKDIKIAGKQGNLVPIGAWEESKQTSIVVTTEDGRSLSCGEKHPVLTASAECEPVWIQTGTLRVGQWVATPRNLELRDVPYSVLPNIGDALPQELNTPLPILAEDSFCEFLGMWFADGCLIPSDKKVSFTEKSKERMDALKRCASSMGWEWRRQSSDVMIDFPSRVYKLLSELGCQQGAKNKTIPKVITGRKQWASFLRGMFDTHIVKDGLMMTVENRSAGKSIQLALLGFGIQSRAKIQKTGSVHLYISGVDALRYLEMIGFSEDLKAEKLLKKVAKATPGARGKADVIPFPEAFIRKAKQSSGWRDLEKKLRGRVAAILHSGLNISVSDYVKVAEVCDIEPVMAEYRWIRIKSIEKGKEDEMIDFDVPDGRAFVAGGIVTHNSNIGGGRFEDSEKAAMGSWAWKHGQLLSVALAKGGRLKDSDDKFVGHKVRWEVKKGKAGTHDGKTGMYQYFHFPKMEPAFWKDVSETCYGGVGEYEDIVETAKSSGILKTSGAWLEHEPTGLRANGAAAFARELALNPDITEIVKMECLRKHNIMVRHK